MAKVQMGQHVDIWKEIINLKCFGLTSMFRIRLILTSVQVFWGVYCCVLYEFQEFHDYCCPNEDCSMGNEHD